MPTSSLTQRFAPGLVALSHYNRAWLRADLIAGVSVAAVAIPIAIAYSQLAGVPAVYGLYASILPLVAYAVFGTSRQLIMAPDAATCAIVAAVVAPLAAGDAARQVSLTMTLSVLTGLFCIGAGLARLGFLTNFLARPILTGYLNGIAISIIIGQLGKLFGYSLQPGGFFRQAAEFVSRLEETQILTLVVGAAMFVALRVLRRISPVIPGPLVAVAAGIAISSAFDLGGRGVALVGSIPAGLPALRLPDVSLSDLEKLAAGAVGIAFISFNSAMVTARGFAVKNRYDIDPNQEFIALGVSDIGSGLLQGFPVSGADSRTAVNDAVGGKSQVTGLVAAALLVVTLLVLTGPLALLPITVLAAVLIHAAIGLFDIPALLRLKRISVQEFRLSLVTLIGVITVGVLPGVVIAVVMALLQLLVRASRPHDALLGRKPGSDSYHDMQIHPDAVPIPGMVLFRFDAALLFFNSDHFKSRVRAVVDSAGPDARILVLNASTMPLMDSTGAAALSEVWSDLQDKGVVIAIAEARGPLRSMLDASGLTQQVGAERCFQNMTVAVAWAEATRDLAARRGQAV